MSKHPAEIELEQARLEFSRAAEEYRAAEAALDVAERSFNVAIEREQKAAEAVEALPFRPQTTGHGQNDNR